MKAPKNTKTKKDVNSYFEYLDQLLLNTGTKDFIMEIHKNLNNGNPVSIHDYAKDRCSKGLPHGEVAMWLWEKAVELCQPKTPKPYYPFCRDPYLNPSKRINRRNAFEASLIRF